MLESASGGGAGPGGSGPRGVSGLGGDVCSWGVSAPRGLCVSAPGGGGPLPGGLVSLDALRQTPPVNRMTNKCKNITLATTSLRSVTMLVVIYLVMEIIGHKHYLFVNIR